MKKYDLSSIMSAAWRIFRKLFCNAPYPFAIMCDRENEYTALFDEAVILKNPQNAYFDKFELLTHTPFDETIFIDADCLAYADLNDLWDYFAPADDFTGCGTNYSIDSKHGLFQANEIGTYKDRVRWKPVIHGGLYFFRKGKTCNAIYRDCQKIIQHYDEFKWPDYCAPYADEPVLCLAMAANGCRALDANPANYGIPWEVTQMKCDIFTGKCTYATEWHPEVDQGRMIHWSVRYCKKPLYKFEVEKLNVMLKYDYHPRSAAEPLPLNIAEILLYKWKLRYFWFCLNDFSIRAVNKMKRICKKLLKISN